MLVRNHGNNVVQRQQTVAFDFRVDVLAHGAQSQQPHQFDVVPNVEPICTWKKPILTNFDFKKSIFDQFWPSHLKKTQVFYQFWLSKIKFGLENQFLTNFDLDTNP